MSVGRVLSSVLPPPRRRVTLRSALPLVVFVAAFLGACIALELFGVMVFSLRRAFLLTAAFPWIWWMHVTGYSGLRGTRWVVALLTRFLVVALFIVLLAEPRAVRRSDRLSVVYALDVSDSIGGAASEVALEYVAATVTEKSESDRAGLVVFGRDAGVELPPRTSFPFEAINSLIAGDGTDLGKALSLAAAMLPDDHLGRIVLISDGVQTEGSVTNVLDQLAARGIPVDVLPVQYDYGHEVWLEKLELPRTVKAGETYDAAVVLSSLQAGSGRLQLLENGQSIYEGTVEFEPGKSRFVLPIYMRAPGYYRYVARIDVDGERDGWEENNRVVGSLHLKGEGKVLVVTDPNGDRRDWEQLVSALRRAEFSVQQSIAFELPADPLSLAPYDCVVFVNVPADAFDVRQLQAVHDAVHDQGIGFLMVGGEQSYGAGGYQRTAVEKALPVSMDISQKKVLPKGALVIILHTCEFAQGNTWGKRIAKEAIGVLSAQDEVGALAYGFRGVEWLFKLTPAGEYERLVRTINQAHMGDMPSFGTTMEMGLDGLKASDASTKHMIIISDGDPTSPTPQLLEDFVDAKVSVSTVAINPHADRDVGVMRAIARATGGRFYFPRDPARLPAIFIKEAKTLRRNMVQNVTFVPAIQVPSPILKGIDAFPSLRGYVLTTPKGRALTVLKGPEAEEVDPVLATWRYGVGKTAAFTSDLSPRWAAEWIHWEKYVPFVKQLMSEISRSGKEGHLQARCFADGQTGMVLVEDTCPEPRFLEMAASVDGPHGRSQSVELRQVGPGRYEARFPLWGKGRYRVVAVSGGAETERVVEGFVVPYSPEYLRFRSDPQLLRQVADKTGGQILTGDPTGDEVFADKRDPRSSSLPVADLFLVALACLVPLDVAVRRIQLDRALILGWLGLGGEMEPSGETMEALLRRKRELEMARADAERPRKEPVVAHAADGSATELEPAEADEGVREGESTLRRLLDKKRTWEAEED